MKKCPYCAEEIQDEAIVCRFCGREFLVAPVKAQDKKLDVRKTYPPDYVLFSAKGRIPRSIYWGYFLLLILLALLFPVLAIMLDIKENPLVDFLYYAYSFFLLISAIFVCIKRCHDLNWSGWFVLLAFVPFVDFIIGSIWAFGKGTEGLNKYGPDPTQ